MQTTANRYLRLNPRSRTRLTNGFFVLAASLSIITVSLGMGGVGGPSLPCPARRSGDSRVGLSDEDGSGVERSVKGKGREITLAPASSGMEKWKKKGRFLDDPDPVGNKQKARVASSTKVPSRTRSIVKDERGITQEVQGIRSVVGRVDSRDTEARQDWFGWLKA